jgi:3-hydroxybutyryl-CoA dehydrogenase
LDENQFNEMVYQRSDICNNNGMENPTHQTMPAATVLVAGAGSIGLGVARSFIASGYRTLVLTRSAARLAALLPGAELVESLPQEPVSLVIECLPERVDLKLALFRQLEAAWGGSAVLASNTSSLDLERLAASLSMPERFIGLHYLYPADQAEFVEVVRTRSTADAVVQSVEGWIRGCGKTPLTLQRAVVGALVNRLQHALLREAYYLVEEGVVTVEQIDSVAKRLLGPRMCVTGLLEQKDISGLDTHITAHATLIPHLHNATVPAPHLTRMLEDGEHGLKSGRGFYDWADTKPELVRSFTSANVGRVIALMKELGLGHGRSLSK